MIGPKEGDPAQQFTLRNTSGKDVRFRGWKLAERDNFNPDAVDKRTNLVAGSSRWKERAVYQTEGGKIVCHKLGRSNLRGEVDRGEVMIVATDADVTKAAKRKVVEDAMLRKAGVRSSHQVLKPKAEGGFELQPVDPERIRAEIERIDAKTKAELTGYEMLPEPALPVEEQIKAFFGNDPLAKDLLEDLGIADVEEIE